MLPATAALRRTTFALLDWSPIASQFAMFGDFKRQSAQIFSVCRTIHKFRHANWRANCWWKRCELKYQHACRGRCATRAARSSMRPLRRRPSNANEVRCNRRSIAQREWRVQLAPSTRRLDDCRSSLRCSFRATLLVGRRHLNIDLSIGYDRKTALDARNLRLLLRVAELRFRECRRLNSPLACCSTETREKLASRKPQSECRRRSVATGARSAAATPLADMSTAATSRAADSAKFSLVCKGAASLSATTAAALSAASHFARSLQSVRSIFSIVKSALGILTRRRYVAFEVSAARVSTLASAICGGVCCATRGKAAMAAASDFWGYAVERGRR